MWDEDIFGTQAKRTFIGDFFEDLAAKVLKCDRLALSSEIESCADLRDDNNVFYEVKGSQSRSHGFRLPCCQIFSYIENMKWQKTHVRYAMFEHGVKSFKDLNSERAITKALAKNIICGIVVDIQFLVNLIEFAEEYPSGKIVRSYRHKHPAWKTWEHYICLFRNTVRVLSSKKTYKDTLKSLNMNPDDFKWIRKRCKNVRNHREKLTEFPLTKVLYRDPEPFEYTEEELPF